MAVLLMLIVGGVVAVGVIAAVVVVLVRLTDSSPKSAPYVPHTWQPPSAAPATPGWYPDHSDATLLRYFDGRQWTSATRPQL